MKDVAAVTPRIHITTS